MSTTTRGSRQTLGIAALIGAAGALALLPQVRSTVAAQIMLAAGRQPEWLQAAWSGPRRALEPGLCRAIAQAPDDPSLQIGAATVPVATAGPLSEQELRDHPQGQLMTSIIRRLDLLTCRFPDDASLRAHQLRYLRLTGVWTEPRKKNNSPWLPYPIGWDRSRAATARATLDSFEKAATAGARLEPDNAFFPAMQSAAAFAEGRNEEALDHLHAAAQRKTWEDHTADEARAKSTLLVAAYGEQSSIQKADPVYRLLFWHYPLTETLAYLAVWDARQREQAGDVTRSRTIRHDVMRLGMLIAGTSSLRVGKEIGLSAFDIAVAGYSPPPPAPPVRAGELRPPFEPLRPYEAHLRADGQTDEANWVRAQSERARRMRDQIQYGPSNGEGWYPMRLASWWLCDILLIRMVGALLLLWGIAALIAGRRRGPEPARVRRSAVGWYIACLVLLLAPAARLVDRETLQAVWDQMDLTPALRLTAALALVWCLAPLLAWLEKRGGVSASWPKVARGVTALLCLLFAPLTLTAVLGAEPRVMTSLVIGAMLSGLLWLSQRAGGQQDRSTSRPRWKPGIVAVISILPSLLFTLPVPDRVFIDLDTLREVMRGSPDYSSLSSVLWLLVLLPAGLLVFLQLCRVAAMRWPLRSGMARGLRQSVPYAIAALLVAYVVAQIPTAAADRMLEEQIGRFMSPPASVSVRPIPPLRHSG